MSTELTLSTSLYRSTLSTDDQHGWKVLSIAKDTGDVHASARGDNPFAAVCAAEWQGMPAYIGEELLTMAHQAGVIEREQ